MMLQLLAVLLLDQILSLIYHYKIQGAPMGTICILIYELLNLTLIAAADIQA